jgi:peptidoglycan/LPS O-acetylase OafA/YrhL
MAGKPGFRTLWLSRKQGYGAKIPRLRRLGLLYVDPSTGSKLPGIQGVRALAAFSILTLHVWFDSAPDGIRISLGHVGDALFTHLALGVALLFVLSGFLLYRPFAAAVMRARRLPSLRRYLVNRALRIVPAYWFILLFASFVLSTTRVRSADGFRLETGALTDPLTLVLNLTFLHNLYPPTLFTGIGVAWALTTVVTFYVLLPLLVLLAVVLALRASDRKGRRLAALAPVALLFVVGISAKVLLVVLPRAEFSDGWAPDRASVFERSFFGHADFFALGLLVAVLRVDSEDGLLRLPPWWRKAVVATMVAIAIPTAVFTAGATADGSGRAYVYDALMVAVCALLLILVVLPAHGEQTRLVRIFESRPVFAVGLVSYSLFIWHLPIIFWLRAQGLTLGGPPGFVLNLVVVATISFVLATLTYRYLEFPALRHKSRGPRLAAAQGPATDPGPPVPEPHHVDALEARPAAGSSERQAW